MSGAVHHDRRAGYKYRNESRCKSELIGGRTRSQPCRAPRFSRLTARGLLHVVEAAD